MSNKKTSSELEKELMDAYRRIAELEKNEARFATILENSPVAIGISRLSDLRLIYVNSAFADLFGYSQDEILKSSTVDLGMWKDLEDRKKFFNQVKDKHKLTGLEVTLRPQDGKEKNVLVKGERVEIDNQPCFVSQVIDITELKQSEAALQASEANYRNLVENSESAIAVLDQNGNILFANLTAIEIWNDKNLVGKTIYDLFPPEYAQQYSRVIQSVIKTQIGKLDEIQSIISGKLMWFRMSMTPLKNPDGTISTLLMNAWDITDRKVAEQSLLESEDKYRTLINATSDGVFVAQDEKFVFCNQSLPAMLGYTREEFEDIPFGQVLVQEHIDVWLERFHQRIHGEHVVSNYQVQFKNKTDTQHIWVELRVNKIEYGGRPAVLGIVRDITEQKNILTEIENLAKFPAENPGPVLRIDLNGKLLYANEASFALLSEWTLEVGKPAPVDIQSVTNEVIASEQDKTVETMHNNRKIVLDFIFMPRKGYINIYGRDITEQRHAEEEVHALQEFSQAIIDALSSHLCVLDENGFIISVNRAWRKFAEDNPPIPQNYGIGTNYLAVCEAASSSDADAFIVARDLHAVLAGEKNEAYIEYPCHSPTEELWFYLSIRRFESKGATRLLLLHENITHRKQMENEVLNANQRFTELAEHVSDIFWVSEPVTRRNVYVNPAFVKVTGMSMEAVESLPNDFLDLVLPEDQPTFLKNQELEESGFKTDSKYRIRRPDGMIRWLHDRATPVIDSTGKVVRIVGISSDITDRVESERRLNETEIRFRQIAEAMPEAFWMFDNETKKFVYMSPAYETIWKRSPQELLEGDNQFFIDSVLPEDHVGLNESFRKQEHGEPTEMEYRITRPDGSVRWIYDRSFPIFDEETGKLLNTAGVAADVTEQKLAGEALKDSEERLRLSLAAAHQGLYDLNVQTGDAVVNREYVEMLGYEFESFHETFQNWVDRLHPDDKDVALNAFSEYINGNSPEYQVEFRQKTKDGSWKWLLSMGKIVEYDAMGKPLRMLGTHTNIDAAKQAEFELKRRAAQLALINDVGRKVAGVLDIHGVLDLSAYLVHEYFDYHHVGLFTLNEKKSHMVMRAKAGKYAPLFPTDHSIPLGEGIVGSVGASGEMILTNQTTESQTYRNFFPAVVNTASELGLPIKIAGQVIGVLDVQSPLPNAFTSNDIQVLQTLADQVAIALENARLYESSQQELTERQKLIRDLEMLVEAGRALSESLDPKSIYPLIYHYLSKVMPCDFVVVSSYDPKSSLIRCEFMHSSEGPQDVSNFPPIPLEPPDHGTQSRVIRSGTSLLLPDYEAALQTASTVLYFDEKAEIYTEVDEDRTRSAIIVPLKVNGMVAGVLQVLSTELRAHTHDHLRFTEALAFHVSSALSNAQLFSELEERVRERTAEVQDLYDNAPAGYHSLDASGRIVLINQTELGWLGYTRDEVVGRHISNFLTKTGLENFQETFPIFKYSGSIMGLELEMCRKDGSNFPTLVNATAIKDEEGNYLLSRSTVFDNTDRKKSEMVLREREEVYRALFENANDAIFMLKPDGTIIGANPRSIDLLGIPYDELPGRNALEFIVNDGTEHAADQINRLLTGEQLPVYERTFKRIDGTLIEAEINLSLIRDEAGKPKFIQSVVRDISTRKRAEETLHLANAEMQRALRLKDEFLANMSHELRTPLNAVLGITESLLEQISGPLSEKQQKYLQTILESAQHLLELINDILDLAKINAGRIELDINKVDVPSLAQSSLRMVREIAQKKGVMINLQIDPQIKSAWADERRLKQMLVNLLSNAVKFTTQGGNIGLEINGDRTEHTINFIVWDTGIGIKSEDLHLLFKPFVQLDAGLARGSQGTGLGLALVSQMARLHGGRVTVESEPQKGSRFIITIPWVELAKTGSLSHPVVATPLLQETSKVETPQNYQILLVEDTESVTMLVSDYLKKHGYKVLTAQDGFEGLDRIREVKPDLILMDVMMPEMDGIETTRRIREQVEMKNVPIIALTALAMAGDRERCLEAGMNDYLSKPVKLKELLNLIEHYLKSGKEGTQ
ncbi:MAG: PAS domain S-box protein [Anaerolineales bacterium]